MLRMTDRILKRVNEIVNLTMTFSFENQSFANAPCVDIDFNSDCQMISLNIYKNGFNPSSANFEQDYRYICANLIYEEDIIRVLDTWIDYINDLYAEWVKSDIRELKVSE